MDGEWKYTSLREAGVKLIDCDHRTPPAAESGFPYVAIPQLKEGRIVLNDVRRISSEHFEEWTRKAKPQHHDVILSRRCNPGETACVPAGLECALGQNLVLLRADGTKLYPPFLRWLVRGSDWWEQVGTFINVGAVFDSLKCADIPNFRMRLPPLPEQQAIASVLGALDDKIELNRRMNATLEAMARALFQSWFVDFDPVRAKIDGRQPVGMDKATAALFPEHLADSLLGHIPKGWKAGKLGEFMQVGIGGAWGEESPNSKQSVTVRCLRGIDCHDLADRKLPEVPVRYLSERQFADRKLTEGCILVEGSGSFCGRSMVWLPEFERLVGDSVCYSNFCKRLDPLCSPSQALVSWMQLRAANDTGELANFRTGTAFPNFDINGALLRLDVVCPPKELCERYMETYRSWLRLDLVQESRTLATLRDTLLPKLLSGELSVADVETSR